MIKSPIYSFVDFENRITTALPSYNLGIAFQFLFDEDDDISPDDHLSVGAQPADDDDAAFILASSLVNIICYWGKLSGVDFTSDFPVVVSSDQIIPLGTYNTLQDLLDALALVGFNTTTETTFLQCCTDNIQNYTITTDKGDISINFYVGLVYVDLEYSSNESTLQSNGILYNDCFKIVLFNDDVVLGRSNKFKRISDNRFLTKLSYYNNEDAFDFHYPQDLINKIWLPFYLRKPSPLVTRKIYRRSNKTYKVQFSTIEKELEATTDYFPEAIHDRLVVALEHDNKHVFSDGRYKIDDDIFMNSDYNIAWQTNDIYDVPLDAPATFKVLKYFAGRNSNCEQRPLCIPLPTPGGDGGGGGDDCVAVDVTSVALPAAEAGIPYSEYIPYTGDDPVTLSGPAAPGWMIFGDPTAGLIHVSGTPDESDVGTGISVGFHLSNCEGVHSVDFSGTIDVDTALEDVTLTLGFVTHGVNSFTATLSAAVDADVNITKVFADGFDTGDCSDAAVGSAQFNDTSTPFQIASGGTGASHGPETTSGDLSTAITANVYNAIVNGSSVVDGSVITIGSASVTIIINNCS